MLLRELYEAQAKRIVAVMPGGFHPFHPGHKSLYDWAVKTFGQGNVYVAATNDTAARPFPFDVKKKLASMAGVPESNFIQVKSPFNAMSYQDIVDDNTALVFVRSEKDKAEHPKPDQTKKNGEPGYLRTYTGKDLNSSNEMGYMAYGPTINFDFSGMQIKSASELRSTWPNMSDEDKHKAAALMYGDGHDEAVQLLDKALGGSDAPVEEWAMPALKGAKYAFQISKWLWNNKWAITFFMGAWKTIDWASDAIEFARKYLDNPIVRAMTKYALPAVGVAIALYGGKKLYDELIQIKDERELDKMIRDFQPDMDELETLKAELQSMIAEK
jgi:hypothetical protein